MPEWCGIALALREPEDDALASRIPTYLHPLAGRTLAWHVLDALASLEPPAHPLFLVGPPELHPATRLELPARLLTVLPGLPWWDAVAAALPGSCERILVVDAAAAALQRGLGRLQAGPPGRILRGQGREVLAAWLDREQAAECCAGERTLEGLGARLEEAECSLPEEAFLVRDRATLARAAAVIRDRTVARLMAGGATFLAPDTVIVDVGVTVGPDTVIYPGVVLEGETSIGAETVVGPSCRLVDAEVGSGVELKGWNYIVRSRIRNRAVLEPYVRRGFD